MLQLSNHGPLLESLQAVSLCCSRIPKMDTVFWIVYVAPCVVGSYWMININERIPTPTWMWGDIVYTSDLSWEAECNREGWVIRIFSFAHCIPLLRGKTNQKREETQFERRESLVIVVISSTNSKASFSWRGDKEASCREMSESVFWHIAHWNTGATLVLSMM